MFNCKSVKSLESILYIKDILFNFHSFPSFRRRITMIKLTSILASVLFYVLVSGDTSTNEILAKKIAEILSFRQKNVIFLRSPSGGLPVLIPLDFEDDAAMDRIFCGTRNKTKFEIIQQTLENLYASTVKPIYLHEIYPTAHPEHTHVPHYEHTTTTHAPHYEHSTTTTTTHAPHYEHSTTTTTTHAPHYVPSTTHAPHYEHHEHYETTKTPIVTTKKTLKPFWLNLFTTPRPIYYKNQKEVPLNEEKHEEQEESVEIKDE